MEILYEDSPLIVALKSPDCISEFSPNGDGFADRIQAHCKGYVGVIHRLDRGVGGVMVYAKTPACAAALSDMVRTHAIKKEYLAVVHGAPAPDCGELRDLLFHDRIKNKTFVADRARKGVKEAILDFSTLQTVESDGNLRSLLRVRLHTGRTHQIRVQFSSRGHALLGDGKYGSREKTPMGLFCASLAFAHPVTKKPLVLSAKPEGEPWDAFDFSF